MIVLSKDTINVYKENEVILFRNRVKEYAVRMGMSILNQTKIITAASELVRNMLRYGKGGQITIEVVTKNAVTGLKITFADQGPGIENIELVMKDGYSTGNSMGIGLPGARRLVNEFEIKSEPGQGTTVTIIRWKNAV